MNRITFVTTALVVVMVTSAISLPALGGSSPFEADKAASGGVGQEQVTDAVDRTQNSFEPVSTGGATTAQASLTQEHESAVENGVDEGIALVQAQGIEVTQEQRAAAIEGANEAVAQHQAATVEQMQKAVAGAVHGSLIQEQQIEAVQIQRAVGGAVDGALEQHQSANASQLQSATWGATHGALAQEQRATVEQIHVAARGAAAGAASGAGEQKTARIPVIQEAAQGAAYGVLEQYQRLTVEQRQQVTLNHTQHAAAGASAGALEGSSQTVLEQEQRVDIEQYQRVTIKQVQKAAIGAAMGALVQQQTVSIEQTQAAARGASAGSLLQVQSIRIEQVQRITTTQIQEASFGAATGSISQSQQATVEQIQAAAVGASQGVLIQRQEVSITQVQHAAIGASMGAITSAVQRQVVEIEQIQAAARGAGQGAVVQRQVISITQVQKLAAGAANGSLSQHQQATVEQTQTAATVACEETARAVQHQRISTTQIQVLTQDTAADAATFAAEEGTKNERAITQHVESELEQRVKTTDELEGNAQLTFNDQSGDGETVIVDSVNLSKGGFVAIHNESFHTGEPTESVRGVSAYLEPGEHENVSIPLEKPLEGEQQLLAVAHLDTNGNEAFDYADTDGRDDAPYVGASGVPVLDQAFVSPEGEPKPEPEPEPEATLLVDDQEGNGTTMLVNETSASVEYTLTAEYDGERVESQTFDANETVENLTLELAPPIEENTTVTVAVVDTDGQVLTNETIEYTLAEESEPSPGPNATLSVTNQTGNGENLTVDEANATVEYALTVSDENGTQLAETELLGSNETIENESITLDPPLEGNTTLEVALVDAGGAVIANETVEYTVEEPSDEPSVEFVNCTRAEVTGSFAEGDSIIVATSFYESSGIGNTIGEYGITVGEEVEAPLSGTVVFTVGEEFAVTETQNGATVEVPPGAFGAAITGISSPDAVGGEIDHANPDGAACLEEVRPELPELNVVETTPTDNAIEVTFGYENPNNAPLIVGSEFVEGTTDDNPIEELTPGNGTFTVEWTPQDDDERLVWAVDMSHYDYDEPLTVETPTAGEIQGSDSTAFAVSISQTNTPVEQGEPLTVEAIVENAGGEAGTQTVGLEVDGVAGGSETISLEPGASTSVTLTADTESLEPGTYAARILTGNAIAETTVTVEPAPDSSAGGPVNSAENNSSNRSSDGLPGTPVDSVSGDGIATA